MAVGTIRCGTRPQYLAERSCGRNNSSGMTIECEIGYESFSPVSDGDVLLII